MCDEFCDSCNNELSLCKLCAKKARIKHLCVCEETVSKSCIKEASIEHLMVQDETANNICAQDIKSVMIEARDVTSTTLCSQQGTIQDLCVNNLTVGTLNHCEKYRAAVTYPSDTLYQLGDNVDWTTILDDPNNNVALSPFSYTVPVSGYYNMSYYINSSGLTGAAVIAGNPIGLLTVSVNNMELRQFNSPYLAFVDRQHAMLSSIMLLNAGDVIRMKYDVQILDAVLGQTNYVGTILLKGNGSFPNSSGFEVHYLSSLNCMPGQTCMPCAPVQIPCQPITVKCDAEGHCFNHCEPRDGESGGC